MFSIPVFLAVTISKPAYVGGLAALAAAGAYLITRKDSAIETRRREAVKLSRVAAENGMPMISGILEAYAVGDYSGIVTQVGVLHDRMTDEKERKAVWRGVLETQLDKHVADPVLFEELLAAIEKRKPDVKITRPPKTA